MQSTPRTHHRAGRDARHDPPAHERALQLSHSRELASLGALDTEAVRPELAELDVLDVPDLVALMTSESTRASDAVVAATPQIARAVAGVARRLAEGGRLIYVGAGTAGRLGVLDAAEAGPTFDVPDGLVLAVLAGGSDRSEERRAGNTVD